METNKRVVSFFIWDPELERKIDCEVKMIDGISKLFNVATTLEQTIECHKALILSQQRMLAFMSEIQRKQQNLLQSDRSEIEPTKATVLLSDIHLPLKWANMKGRSEQKKFAVFCLARIGCEILDTKLESIDKQTTEIVFTDKLLFENVPYNFRLILEIYAINKTLTLSSAAKDFADRYSYFSTHYSSKNAFRTTHINNKSSTHHQSKFVLIAQTILTKEDVFKFLKIRELKLLSLQENALLQLPISSSFIAYFIVQPLCYTRLATFAGLVEIFNIKYSCLLTREFLQGEEIMRNDFSDQHRFAIPITSDTIILSRDNQLSFTICNRGFDQEEFFVKDLLTLKNWIRALQQHIVDIREWQVTFEHQPSTRRFSYQPLISSPMSSVRGRTLRKQSMLQTKTLSLGHLDDDLQQTNIIPIDLPSYTNHLTTDDDDAVEYHTRL